MDIHWSNYKKEVNTRASKLANSNVCKFYRFKRNWIAWHSEMLNEPTENAWDKWWNSFIDLQEFVQNKAVEFGYEWLEDWTFKKILACLKCKECFDNKSHFEQWKTYIEKVGYKDPYTFKYIG